MFKQKKALWTYEVYVYIDEELVISAQFHKKKLAKAFVKKCTKIYSNVTRIEFNSMPIPF